VSASASAPLSACSLSVAAIWAGQRASWRRLRAGGVLFSHCRQATPWEPRAGDTNRYLSSWHNSIPRHRRNHSRRAPVSDCRQESLVSRMAWLLSRSNDGGARGRRAQLDRKRRRRERARARARGGLALWQLKVGKNQVKSCMSMRENCERWLVLASEIRARHH